jgi:hypothetical protein
MLFGLPATILFEIYAELSGLPKPASLGDEIYAIGGAAAGLYILGDILKHVMEHLVANYSGAASAEHQAGDPPKR